MQMIIVISWNVGKYDRTKLTLNMKGIEKNWRGILNKVIQDFSQFGSGSSAGWIPNNAWEREKVILDILQQLVIYVFVAKVLESMHVHWHLTNRPTYLHRGVFKFFLLLKTMIFQMMMIIPRGSSLIGCLAVDEIRSASQGRDKYEQLHIIFRFTCFLRSHWVSEWVLASTWPISF